MDSGSDAGATCANPATTVPASEIPPYQPVMQVIGACSGAELAGYVTACDSSTSTGPTCNAWFSGDASSTACQDCLFGPITGSDPPMLTGQGGIWIDYQGNNIGGNAPGCLDLKGMSGCASAYQNIIQCIVASGCESCADGPSYQACLNIILNTGGACATYYSTYQSSCAADNADGGLLNGGVCSTTADVLSVICGNGSGDGG